MKSNRGKKLIFLFICFSLLCPNTAYASQTNDNGLLTIESPDSDFKFPSLSSNEMQLPNTGSNSPSLPTVLPVNPSNDSNEEDDSESAEDDDSSSAEDDSSESTGENDNSSAEDDSSESTGENDSSSAEGDRYQSTTIPFPDLSDIDNLAEIDPLSFAKPYSSLDADTYSESKGLLRDFYSVCITLSTAGLIFSLLFLATRMLALSAGLFVGHTLTQTRDELLSSIGSKMIALAILCGIATIFSIIGSIIQSIT